MAGPIPDYVRQFAASWADPAYRRRQLLVGFGRTDVDWPFARNMPASAIYRLTVDV